MSLNVASFFLMVEFVHFSSVGVCCWSKHKFMLVLLYPMKCKSLTIVRLNCLSITKHYANEFFIICIVWQNFSGSYACEIFSHVYSIVVSYLEVKMLE
jgi:hypothetical protein